MIDPQLDIIPAPPDLAREEVVAAIREIDPDGHRMAKVFRETFDQLYDGQRTGRYRVDQLFKTEKTHFGTLIEINLQRELRFDDGDTLDFKIAGHEVDCKYSHTGAWMLPIESFDRLALVTKADDSRSLWSAGLIRVTADNRRTSENRDRKTGLNNLGRSRIDWVFLDAPMQPNALLRLDRASVDAIMAPKSGQQRVNELFRRAENTRITRNIVATVAQQADYMKRARDNGGARSLLRAEGFLILGGDYQVQAQIARNLGVVKPLPGELVSVRVAPCGKGEGVEIDGRYWRRALDGEVLTVPAPHISRRSWGGAR